jgi:uncharacterized protein YndB with AHSA1/START domain
MERTYSFDVDDVWHAWTDPERVARWLGTASGELAEGGVVHLRMSPPDADPADIATLVVLRCDAQRRLTVRWSWRWRSCATEDQLRRSMTMAMP